VCRSKLKKTPTEMLGSFAIGKVLSCTRNLVSEAGRT